MKARARWVEGMAFMGESGSGHAIVMDGAPEYGGRNLGIRPMEMLLIGLAGDKLRVHLDEMGRVVRESLLQLGAKRAFVQLCGTLRQQLSTAQRQSDEIHHMLGAAFLAAAAVGWFNGFMVNKTGLPSFIITLASFIWVRGLVLAISGGRSAQDLDPAIRWFAIERFAGIPLSAWIAIGCFLIFSIMMGKTPFGRHLIMIGGNETAAYRAGIRVTRNLIIAFVMAGAIAGLAGWLLAVRTSGATANLGIGLLFNAFAAVVIGGVSLKGGVGALPGVYAGVLLLSSINTAINLMGLPANYTQVIHGFLVLAAVLLDTFKQRLRQRLA